MIIEHRYAAQLAAGIVEHTEPNVDADDVAYLAAAYKQLSDGIAAASNQEAMRAALRVIERMPVGGDDVAAMANALLGFATRPRPEMLTDPRDHWGPAEMK